MILETERLILRPFLTEDAGDVYEYLKKPTVNCFASMKLHSLEEARAEVNQSREGVFLEFISFVKNLDGSPRYENTVQYAILKKEWDQKQPGRGCGKENFCGKEQNT